MTTKHIIPILLLLISCSCFALDREAFTFTSYQLQVKSDPPQHGLAATGILTLRNDSTVPQKNVALQISSSLAWLSIALMPGEKKLAYITHPYESDIDHTGEVTEAVVTLPAPIAPGATVQLEVDYSGQIQNDATRLEKIGTPKEVAAANDWDEIASSFTALRGVGYVAWYPVAIDSVSLKDAHAYGLELGRWRAREAEAQMAFEVLNVPGQQVEMNDALRGSAKRPAANGGGQIFLFDPLAWRVPILVAGNYAVSKHGDLEIHALSASKEQLDALSDGAAVAQKMVDDWLPRQLATQQPLVQVFQLPDTSDVPFESGAMLFQGFSEFSAGAVELRMAHQFAHANFYSPRPWIYEGLANLAQALMAEQQGGRDAAIAYMKQQLTAVVQEEKDNQADSARAGKSQTPDPSARVFRAGTDAREPSLAQDDNRNGAATSLINGADELLYRSKAMYVCWMLRDMLGDAVVKSALAEYKPENDKDSSYMQRLLEQASRAKRVFPKLQLEEFFDDWVYRDRGLPDFRVKSSYTRKLLGGAGGMNYMATITVENVGNAGAEVPVTVVAGEHERVTKRLAVPANGEASIRIPTAAVPTSAEINDGSVPETDMTNNTASIAPPSE